MSFRKAATRWTQNVRSVLRGKSKSALEPRKNRLLIELLEDRTLLSTLYALDTTNDLLRFDSATPGTIDQNTPITGLTAGQTLVGINFQPGTGQLFGLGQNAANTFGQLYTIDTTSGSAATVGAGFSLPQAATASSSGFVGFSFDPVLGNVRIIGAGKDNYRVGPISGAVV